MTNISLLLEKRKQYETKIKESTEKIDYAKKQKPIYCPQVFYNMILSIISLLSTLLLSMVAIFTPDVISKIVLFSLAGIFSAIFDESGYKGTGFSPLKYSNFAKITLFAASFTLL